MHGALPHTAGERGGAAAPGRTGAGGDGDKVHSGFRWARGKLKRHNLGVLCSGGT